MRSYRLADPAQADLKETWYYIAKDDAGMADQWLDRGDQEIDLLTRNQKAGRLRPELGAGIRSWPFGKYVIVYKILTRNLIEIQRILSTYRNLSSQFKGDA